MVEHGNVRIMTPPPPPPTTTTRTMLDSLELETQPQKSEIRDCSKWEEENGETMQKITCAVTPPIPQTIDTTGSRGDSKQQPEQETCTISGNVQPKSNQPTAATDNDPGGSVASNDQEPVVRSIPNNKYHQNEATTGNRLQASNDANIQSPQVQQEQNQAIEQELSQSSNLQQQQQQQSEEDVVDDAMENNHPKEALQMPKESNTDNLRGMTMAVETFKRKDGTANAAESAAEDNDKMNHTEHDANEALATKDSTKTYSNDPLPTTTTTVNQEEMNTKSTQQQTTSDDVMVEPDEDALIASIDNLFWQADKDSVTVGDIVQALEAEFSMTLSKSLRKFVRIHLVDLMMGNAEPSVEHEQTATATSDQTGAESEEEEEEDGEDENEELDDEDQDDDFSAGPEQKDDDDGSDYEPTQPKRKPRAKKKSSSFGKKVQPSKQHPKKRKATKKRPSRRSNARAAARRERMIQAERLRKRRMEELKVRNEELQIQNEQDVQRAQEIAAKFETDTDELRIKRLEARLELLERLDQTRMTIIRAERETNTNEQTIYSVPVQKENVKEPCTTHTVKEEESSSSDDDDDDDEELEIVGWKQNVSEVTAPIVPIITKINKTDPRSSSALSALERLNENSKQNQSEVGHPTTETPWTFAKGSKSVIKPITSPSKSLGARAALRHRLLQKQRKIGNSWLARELGYKTEEEHLKDCVAAAEKKRQHVLKMELARQIPNSRKHMLDRLLLEQENSSTLFDEENKKEKETDTQMQEDEDDEELELAKELEQKQTSSSFNPNDDSNNDTMETVDHTKSPDDSGGDCKDESPNGSESTTSKKNENKQLELQVADDDEGAEFETQPNSVKQSTAVSAVDLPSDCTDVPSLSSDSEERKELSQTSETYLANNMVPSIAQPQGRDDKELKLLPTEESKSSTKNESEETEELVSSSNDTQEEASNSTEKKPRNSAWKAMLQRDIEKAKKQKKQRGGFVDAEAEEEEEEEVAGLEDFGFTIHKKKNGDDDDAVHDEVDAEDLENVVDDVSDNEGDEEAGEAARKRMQMKEEKARHKEILRRVREGYDGRRSGIAGGAFGARGMHRFDQLTAAENLADAKRLGLANDDELDSDEEDDENKQKDNSKPDDEEDDEEAMLDQVIRDRHLLRTSMELPEENFSDDEEENTEQENTANGEDEEERTQEILAKRFAKRARMHRLVELYADDAEFSEQRLIDEDDSMKVELKNMKNGLIRKRSTSSTSRSSSFSAVESAGSNSHAKRPTSTGSSSGFFLKGNGSLSVALRASRKGHRPRTSFLGGQKATRESNKKIGGFVHRSIALSHVVFQASESHAAMRSNLSNSSASSNLSKRRKLEESHEGDGKSLFQKVSEKVLK